MDLELFKKIAPYFPLSKWIYLQGWGEPLLNPHVWEMADIVKKAGCKAGFTSNGTLLNDFNIDKLFKHNIDLISVSIAGSTEETHGKLRRGSHLHQLVESLNAIAKAKRKYGTELPRVHLSYMLTKENVMELRDAINLAVHLEVDNLYTTNLDYVFNKLVNDNKIFTWSDLPRGDFWAIINSCAELALKNGLSFKSYPISLGEEQSVCDLNPRNHVFITCQGDVVPCTYLSRNDKIKIFMDNEYLSNPFKLGSIKDEEFQDIWEKEKYIGFRKPFQIREIAYQQLISQLTGSAPSLARLREAEKNYYKTLETNPFPAECRYCPKRYGI